jgi:hypothetical protein
MRFFDFDTEIDPEALIASAVEHGQKLACIPVTEGEAIGIVWLTFDEVREIFGGGHAISK